MFEYPLTHINKQLWNKKVEATLMFSIPAEDQALPILSEILDVLQNLNNKNLQQVLADDVREYFFNDVFPQVCTKIIKSRYFKNQIVLQISNKILANCLYLYPKFLDLVSKYTGLGQVLAIVLSSDEYYFKTNNQLDYKLYPHYYFQNTSNVQFTSSLQQDDMVDVIKSNGKYDKLIWSRGKILLLNQSYLEIEYLNDTDDRTITIDKQSFQVAPYMSKSKDFQWRMNLKPGDVLDCQDSFGGWYHGTVLKAISHGDNKKSVKITYKVYDQNGNKLDEKGKFYGFTDQEEIFDVTVPKIMPFCSTCKYRNYQVAKSSFQTDDSNDMVFQQIGGQKIYAFPRKRALSQFYFKQLNIFGRMGGFQKPIQKLQQQINFQFFCNYLKGIGNVCQYLHKRVVLQLVQKFKTIIQKHIFASSQLVSKQFTKQRSQTLFSSMKNLMKRLFSTEDVQKYQNTLKMKLVSQCLESQALKRKLQGLHELKDIVRGMSHISQRTKTIKAWIIEQKIFDKIYLQNSHVQLIKKSQDFFKFLINQDILQVKDLQRLYKIAQKGDYQSRVSLYKLFQQMSHIFNKSHVDFLIDTILESDLNLVLNQDIDMLHQLSRFSNYFPKEKVKDFFQRLILNDTKNKQLNDYAIKKYSQIVSRGYQMKNYRRQIIRNFISKINTTDYQKVLKLLKGIFQGISVGQWGKKDLTQILEEEKVQQIIVAAIKQSHSKIDNKKIIMQMLNFELFLVKLSNRIKIKLSTLRKIWKQISIQINISPSKKLDYIQWLNQIVQCDQGIQIEDESNIELLKEFYKQLFSEQSIGVVDMVKCQFILAKNLFIQINKKIKLISVSNVIRDKEIQKQYHRKCQMKSLKLLNQIQKIIFQCKNKQISQNAFKFYLELYSSKQNSPEQISQQLNTLLSKLNQVYESKDLQKIQKTLNMIQMIVNDSQKYQEFDIVSMIKCRKGVLINVSVINDISYISDTIRKQNFYQKSNISLLQLKQKIASKVDLSIQQLKVIGKYQLTNYYNSYTLNELNINSDDCLTISRKNISSVPEEQLILQGKLNPKAFRIFRVLFDKYSTNQKGFTKQDYNKFTGACLGTFSKNYNDKISGVYAKYDSDHDGVLNFNDFIQFYTDSALDKPSTVWSNLKNLGVKGNFKFKDQPDDIPQKQTLPRYKLYNNQQFYDILFNLLEQKQISKIVYNFLLRLPPNKTMHQQARNIWIENSTGKQKLEIFLTEKSKFRFMYKLILILNILQYTQINNSVWNVKFSINKGYQIPFKFLKKISQTKDFYTSIDLDIIELIFQIIKDYIYNSFGTKQSLQSSSLFEDTLTIEQKMQYLITGVYPKTFCNFKRDYSLAFKYQWQDKKQIFSTLFLNMLIKMKHQVSSEKQSQKKTVLSSMIFKLMAILSTLMVNQNQKDLLQIYSIFFDEKQSFKSLNEFYCMILCICFYSHNAQQYLHIHQLFKYIKSKHITSQHFRILALLVSKYGFKQENVTQIPQVLLKNILQEQNQPTIEGCAKLLCNFQISQLKSITPNDVENIFNKCLFGDNITCKKEQARNQIYQFLIKISQANREIAQKVVEKTKNVILENMPLMKVVYSSQVNKKSSYGYAGLKNLGNICYMNSMIQQLFMNKTFRYLILRTDDKKEPQLTFDAKGQQVDDNLLHQIQRMFGYLEHTTRQDFSPSAFCVAYKPFGQSVNIMMQQDVQQFVSMFFDRLEEGIKQHPLRNLIQNFYTGKTTNLFKCHNCKKSKKIEQNFHCITLEVKNSKNLSQSFNRYALGEVINDYKCDFCQQKADVSKMTRISKLPQILIIHLQRISFNLDTFINEKITSRHQFPIQLNIYPYTLQHFDKQQSSQEHPQQLNEYDYQLTGIIVHIGNAESGHYVSFIKTEENKWLQFNDSIISLSSASSIESQCFGGMSSTFEDQFQWQKKQTSKSAYLLIYNRKVDPKIQLIIKQKQLNKNQKQQFLLNLKLQEQVEKIQTSAIDSQKISEPTQSQEQTGSAFEDSQKQKQKQKYREQQQMKQLEMIKQKKSEDNIGVRKDYIMEKGTISDEITLKIRNNVTPYLLESLKQQIQIDNRVHFFQTSLASEGFSTFFANLISIPHLHSEELIKMCQKLTFSFWLKSKSFKQLLHALQVYLKSHPQNVNQLVLQNDQFFSLLIQNSSVDIRVNVAHFLAKVIQNYAKFSNQEEQFITKDSEQGQNIFGFLDKLFELIPTSVTKCWTKFNQYFEFWYLISEQKVFTQYLVQKQVLKHFVDYFLDKKSPLKIYAFKKAQDIGSSYANPDFSMLLRCVSNLLNFYFSQYNSFTLKQEDHTVLVYFQFVEKLISQCYQQIAAKMAKQICPGNIKASEKFAIVLLKGFSKSTYQSIQKYIEVLKQFVAIQDEYQILRIQWVLGKQTLNVSNITKSLIPLNSKNIQQRLYYFQSSINVEQGASFLEPIFHLNKRVQNFCILCVQGIIQICLKSKPVRDYIFHLGPPSLLYTKYIDFFEQFIDRYIEQSKRSYYSTVTYFNKTQLGQQIKESYNKLMQIRKQQEKQQENQQENQQKNQQENQQGNQQQKQQGNQQQRQQGNQQENQQENQEQIQQKKNQPVANQQQVENQGQNQQQAGNGTQNRNHDKLQNKHIISDNYMHEPSNSQKHQKENSQKNKIPCQQYQLVAIQFLNGSFTKDKKVSQDSQNIEVINSPIQDQQQNIHNINNTNNLNTNIVQWQQVNISDDQNKKKYPYNQIIEDYTGYDLDNNQPEIYENLDNNNIKNNNSQQQQVELFNPYYDEQEAESNKNNSRKSQVQGNDSRQEDFNGIEMKDIAKGTQNTKGEFTAQPEQYLGHDSLQYPPVDQDLTEILGSLNQNDNKQSSDWSHQSIGDDLGSYPKLLGQKSRKRTRNKVGLKIQSKKRLPQAYANQNSDQNSEGDENQPFIKHKKSQQKSQRQQKSQNQNFKITYHPIQFIYRPVATLPAQKELSGIQATYHESEVVFIRTKPTGKGNKSFTDSYGSGKMFNRIKQECWQSKKIQITKGYFVTNHSRMHARVQTPEGCQLIKPNQSSWIWSDTILKIWKCQRTSDWPEWSMYD